MVSGNRWSKLYMSISIGGIGIRRQISYVHRYIVSLTLKIGVVCLEAYHAVFVSSSLCAISNMQLYRPSLPLQPHSPIQSLNIPTPPMMSNICVCNYINCFTHICDGRQKRAPGQVTKRSIDAHLAHLGRTHRPASNQLSPATGVPTWPASVPPWPLLTTRPAPPWLCRRANTYTDVDPYMWTFYKRHSNLFNIRFF